MPKKWILKEYNTPNEELVKAAGSEFLAKLLLQRGIDTPQKTQKFLNPDTYEPVSPYAYKDMEKAVMRIKQAIEKKEHILIYGDFDADGVTATAVMHKTFTQLDAVFSHYIPNRQTESHGLNSAVLLKKISKEKVKLVVTVDCAVCDVEEISLAKSLGTDVIIVDHHESKDVLPPAFAIINAKVPGALQEDLSVDDITSLASMAGVGAAFKLACALLDENGQISFAQELLPLVALGTVADVMPLLYENRLFVVLGLKLIKEGKNKGMLELLRAAGANIEEELTSEKIAFTIAPRINAAGRLDSAETAFSLLVGENPAENLIHAQSLNNFNKLRQELCDKTYLEALDYIEKQKENSDAVIVAYNPNWHIGIIGIVASKLVEKFNLPVFMFTDSPDGESFRSSARSIPGINIFNVLEINSDILASYGGHSMAAGLSLDKNATSIAQFKNAVNQTILEITDGVIPQSELEVDLEISLNDLSLSLLEDIKKLEPCGEGNNYPLFAIKNLKLLSERTVGQANNHLKFTCEDAKLNTAECVFWNKTSLYVETGKPLDIAFYPKLNVFNGTKTLQLDIQDYHSKFINTALGSCFKVIDHRKKTGILNQVADYFMTSKKRFKIFAEDKDIVKSLCNSDILKQNIITRLSAEEAEQIMFFDYPADKDLMSFILKAVKPNVVHLMNYRTPIPDIDSLISKVSGMMKYASTHYDGVVYLPNISSALSISDELARLIIKLLNRTNVLKVNDFENGKVHFEFLEPVSVEKIKTHEVYEKCRMELFKSKNFRDSLSETENPDIFFSEYK